MNGRTAVDRLDLQGRMQFRSSSTADQQRRFQSAAFHFLCDINHLIQGRCYQTAESDDVRFLLFGAFQNAGQGHHDAHVNDFVIITSEDDTDNIFADIMDIAFDGSQEYFPFGTTGGSLFGCFQIGRQVSYGSLHHPGTFDHLG